MPEMDFNLNRGSDQGKMGIQDQIRRSHMRKNSTTLLGWVLLTMLIAAQVSTAQIKGLPASDILGSEDLSENPTFVGGGPNGGATAHSEF